MKLRFFTVMLAALLMTGCGRELKDMEQGNSVYFWRTELLLDSVERAFLQQYDIDKVYCRYFDVVIDEATALPRPTSPSATRCLPVWPWCPRSTSPRTACTRPTRGWPGSWSAGWCR